MTLLESAFNNLGIDIYGQGAPFIAASAGVALGTALIISVLTGIAYYSNISALLLFAKPIERKEDVKRTPSGLINRCVVEYMACGESGAPLLSVELIVMKQLLRMSFFGLNFKSLEKLAKALELAVLFIAAAACAGTGEAGWLVFIGALYLVYKIITLFFDSETLRDRLFYGIATYINREIGKFYIADDKAGMRIFKNEVHSSLMEQASILQNSINNLNRELTGAIKAAYEQMGKTLGEDIKKYDNLGEKLSGPVEAMQTLFGRFKEASDALSQGSAKLSESITLLDGRLGTITDSLEKNSAANNRSLESSELIFHELRDSLKSFNAAYASLETELSAVKSAQSALEGTLQSYEVALQQTTGRFGEAVGSVVEYRGREAIDSLNEGIGAYVKQFQSDTGRLLEKMTALFEQSYEQNKSEIQTLLRIEEKLMERRE